ncbi:MAG: ATP-dependent DNA helicase RecG [Minisyncoccales bacterium]
MKMMAMNLSTPIEQIARIGAVFQKKLKKLGIKTVRDILYHFPHRYEDFSNIIPISKVKINENCCILGKILEIKNSRTWKRRMFLTQAVVQDKTGAIKVVWFNQPYLIKTLKPKDNVCLAGKITIGDDGLHLSNPAYEKMTPSFYRNSVSNDLTHTGRIVPVYPETEGLSSRWLRYIIKPLLISFKNKIPEIIPKEIIQKEKLLAIEKAIWQIHFPDSINLAERAQKRFSFEELFLIELAVLQARMALNKEKAISIPIDIELVKKFVETLSFKLTDAQRKSSWQILKDLEKSRPMNRLLEGDVGSGKTIVALMAALETIKAGYQVAFMAPTEILTKQHFKEVSSRFKDFNINIGLLTGKEDKFISKKLKGETIEISRTKLLEKTIKNEINILIGTHALIQDKVKFGNLALVILDEQHRFGVEQRAKLMKNSTIPHLLSMTATPIPRSLALTIYGDLDLSLIDELPKGRKEIITKVIPPAQRKKTYDFIKKEVKRGRQVFIIYPRIESGKTELAKDEISSWAEVKSVKEEYERLSKEVFPKLKLAMLHGKMTPKEKEKIMQGFKDKKIDILVSTSVIEVGIDIPNATVIVIEGAERFGLAQLHQFRGRVGRSKYQSYCFLFTDSSAKKTHQRLKALIASENGFELAEKDLKIRGPGDFSGARQWGIPDLIMNSFKDIGLVEKTRQTAKELLEQDPELKNHPFLEERLKKFRERIHLE